MIDKTNPHPVEVMAVEWAARSTDPDFDDWAGLSAWLAEDPERNRHYDAAMIAIEDGIDEIRTAVALTTRSEPAAPVRRPVRRARRWPIRSGGRLKHSTVAVTCGALAAAVAGVLILSPGPKTPLNRPIMVVEAPAGTSRRVGLEDGSRIEVAGGSRVTIDAARSRVATVDRGRALFTVRHDENAPFSVSVGPHELLDAGTVFEVVRGPGTVRVSVAEGAVILDPGRSPLTLAAGDRAVVRDGQSERSVSRVAPDEVGRWRQARLVYRDAGLDQVADDLAGALAIPVRASPMLAGRRFTGTLVPATLRKRPDALGELLDIRVEVREDVWELRPR